MPVIFTPIWVLLFFVLILFLRKRLFTEYSIWTRLAIWSVIFFLPFSKDIYLYATFKAVCYSQSGFTKLNSIQTKKLQAPTTMASHVLRISGVESVYSYNLDEFRSKLSAKQRKLHINESPWLSYIPLSSGCLEPINKDLSSVYTSLAKEKGKCFTSSPQGELPRYKFEFSRSFNEKYQLGIFPMRSHSNVYRIIDTLNDTSVSEFVEIIPNRKDYGAFMTLAPPSSCRASIALTADAGYTQQQFLQAFFNKTLIIGGENK